MRSTGFITSRLLVLLSLLLLLSPLAALGFHDAVAKDFLAWARQHRIEIDDTAVELKAVGQSSRGLYASKDLAAREKLFRVPVTAMLSVEHAVTSTEIGEYFDMLPDLDDLYVSAAFLVYERFKTASPSPWLPYLLLIPDTIDLPTQFSEKNLNEFQNQALVDTITERKARTQAAFAELSTTLPRSLCPDTLFTWERFQWAEAVLRSRSHLVSIRDDTNKWQRAMALVPIADLLNTHPTDDVINTACYTEDKGQRMQSVFRCETTKKVAKGEQLLVQYIDDDARRSNERLLLDYAFVPATVNGYDSVPISLPERPKAKDRPFIRKILDALHFQQKRKAVLSPQVKVGKLAGLQLLTYCRVITLEETDSPHITDPKTMIELVTQEEPVSHANEVRAITTCVLKALDKELASYPTTMKEDQELLENLHNRTDTLSTEERHYQLAVAYRFSQKQILQYFVGFFLNYVKDGKLKSPAVERADL